MLRLNLIHYQGGFMTNLHFEPEQWEFILSVSNAYKCSNHRAIEIAVGLMRLQSEQILAYDNTTKVFNPAIHGQLV